MKRVIFIFILPLLAWATNASCQQTDIKDSLPTFTYQQMLEDYDTLVSNIKQVSPIIYYNKEVRGIDFEQHARTLRSLITPQTTTGNFLQIVAKTLRAAQDGHTGRLGTWQLDIMKKYWIPDGHVPGIDSADTENAYKYAAYFKQLEQTKLDLNLVYTNGEYYNLLPFIYKGKQYPAAMRLARCNGVAIHAYVASLVETVSPLRWDRKQNRVYEETFYMHPSNFRNNTLQLEFVHHNNKVEQLNITTKDTLIFSQKSNGKYGYNSSSDSLVIHYFEQQGIFYVKLPMMIQEMGDTIKQALTTTMKDHKIRAVVVDIRGNGGGSDLTYSKFLSMIVKAPLRMNIVVGRNFSPFIQKRWQINSDTIARRPAYTFKPNTPTLKEPSMYFIQQSYDFVVPDSNTYALDAKIYILQDRFIYSSASNLSSLAKYSDQLVSIGQTPDLLGGLQADPIVMMLPHSKIIFRVEPQVDFTGIEKIDDLFQNNVEHYVPYTIEQLYLRVTTKEDVNGKQYLLQHDPLFKKVLALEKKP
ncbi:peptidase S41-like protein [Chitinophaga skermanii]|uniref:Peptidase S41-like protein n=1 Tax=Chitinophaga skermanii TaxID=331697 RepID=A0A327QB11_9BACT|nr:S41 family peptidase [Chitinophaga skermanii]RAJ00393.1 peptidase S41-like protein [Chitinophaga skermanii]